MSNATVYYLFRAGFLRQWGIVSINKDEIKLPLAIMKTKN